MYVLLKLVVVVMENDERMVANIERAFNEKIGIDILIGAS